MRAFFQNRRLRMYFPDLILASAVVTFVSGCGGSDGPPRFHVSGEVTYDSKPIPFGEIVFEPDSEANSTGPATTAVIENGVYSTKTGEGVIGGPMVVRISGFDGNPPKGGGTQIHGLPLFKPYSENVELPKEETTRTFNVPAKR